MNRIIKTGILNANGVHHDIIEVEHQQDGLSKFYLVTDKGIVNVTTDIECMVLNKLN